MVIRLGVFSFPLSLTRRGRNTRYSMLYLEIPMNIFKNFIFNPLPQLLLHGRAVCSEPQAALRLIQYGLVGADHQIWSFIDCRWKEEIMQRRAVELAVSFSEGCD